MRALRNLEQIQTRILQRITDLESSLSISADRRSSTASDGGETMSRLPSILRSLGVKDFAFKRVASDYYGRSIEERRENLGAPSVDHLCKGIVEVILDEATVKLDPDYFWLGCGEVDLKLGIRTPEFISAVKLLVVNCS